MFGLWPAPARLRDKRIVAHTRGDRLQADRLDGGTQRRTDSYADLVASLPKRGRQAGERQDVAVGAV
jgi:hypothetical protein